MLPVLNFLHFFSARRREWIRNLSMRSNSDCCSVVRVCGAERLSSCIT